MKKLEESSLIICGIVRNASKGLKVNIPIINALCKYCQDFKVVIYENDSTDETKSILKVWSEEDPVRIHILLTETDKACTIPKSKDVSGNPFFSRKRIEKMAFLRNKYMEYVDAQSWNADYLIVVDLDVAQLEIGGILSSFDKDIEWDAVTAFGYSTSPKLTRRYHDTYALTEYNDEDNPQTEEKIERLADKYGKILSASDQWVKVSSAFGGLAIYRFECVEGLRYQAIKNEDQMVEVYCEHYSICRQMKNNGYDRIYINPTMTFAYQNVTLRIVCNSLVRRFKRVINFLNINNSE